MGRYMEIRAPQGSPEDGERGVWFADGELKFGHYVAVSDTWVVDRSIGYSERVSRLLPEDTTPHFHANAYDGTKKINVREGTMKTGFTKGGTTDGKIILMNLEAFVDNGGTKQSVGPADALRVTIPFSHVKGIDPAFNEETGSLGYWDETTSTVKPLGDLDGVTLTKDGDHFNIDFTEWPTEDPIIYSY